MADDGITRFNGIAWPDGTVVPTSGMFLGVQDATTLQFSYLPAPGPSSVTLTGDVNGSGVGIVTAFLSLTGVFPGTYNNPTITVDGQGRITSATQGDSLPNVPSYQEFSAEPGQTVFNTQIRTVAKVGSKSFMIIFVNGIFQQEGETKEYIVTGATQITFNAGVADGADVVIYGFG